MENEMQESCTAGRVGTTQGRPSALSSWVIRALNRVGEWSDLTHQRSTLGELDDHMLRDIGIDRATAQMEAQKPFWQA
jgi:uncharacterized protein YjiS (DUF1127 family)